MQFATAQPTTLKLSICIATFNRAAFIGETLGSILGQTTKQCEVVVLDGASTDNTEQIVSEYARRFDCLRYIRQQENCGLDRSLDQVVQLAAGEYCWLVSDDDLLKPGAVAAVLEKLQPSVSLVVVNVESRDFTMTKVIRRRWINFESDRVYEAEAMDRLFVEVGEVWRYCGVVVVKREIWLDRAREPYYDTWFVYFGVIFQKKLPGQAVVIATPLVSYRMSNAHTFTQRTLELLWVKWPALVWSMDLSPSAKSKVSPVAWKRPLELFLWRALGYYSLAEYRRFVGPQVASFSDKLVPVLVALLPRGLVKLLLIVYYSTGVRSDEGVWWQWMIFLHRLRMSGFPVRNWRALDRER